MSNQSGRRRDREEDDDDEKQELLSEKRKLEKRLDQGGLDVQLEIVLHNRVISINTILNTLYSSRNSNNNSANANINNNSNNNSVATSAAAAAASSSLNNNNNNNNVIDFDVSATRLDRMSSQQLVALLRHRFGVSAPILKVLIECDVSGASFVQEDFVTTTFTPQRQSVNSNILASAMKVLSEAHGKLWRNFRRFEWSRNERKPATPMQNNVPLLSRLLIANETVSSEIADWVLSFVSSAEQSWSLDLDDVAATLHGRNFAILSKRGGGGAALLGVVVKLEPEEEVINNSNNSKKKPAAKKPAAKKAKAKKDDSDNEDDAKEIDVDAVASSVVKQLQVLKSERWHEIKSHIPNDVFEFLDQNGLSDGDKQWLATFVTPQLVSELAQIRVKSSDTLEVWGTITCRCLYVNSKPFATDAIRDAVAMNSRFATTPDGVECLTSIIGNIACDETGESIFGTAAIREFFIQSSTVLETSMNAHCWSAAVNNICSVKQAAKVFATDAMRKAVASVKARVQRMKNDDLTADAIHSCDKLLDWMKDA